ncbi:MAG: hypothetical protein K2R93_19670, partial [Gemmatimonadaceae bacterium]|nr:hypothetical protein [Gemmatimonadaceae bacterium]
MMARKNRVSGARRSWWCIGTSLIGLLVAMITSAASAHAQSGTLVKVKPNGAITVFGATKEVTVDFCYLESLNGPGTPVIKVNGVDATSSFSFSSVTISGCDVAERATGTVDVPSSVYAYYYAPLNNYLYDDQVMLFAPAAVRELKVVPTTQLTTLRPGVSGSLTYEVRNTGEKTDTVKVRATCSGSGIGTCTVPDSTLYISAGSSGTATVTGTASGTAGTQAYVTLRALSADGTTKDSSWTDVRVAAAPSAGISVVSATDDLDRGSCVTIAAGDAASSECGDLRLVHALPSTTRMNRTRTPALLYSSSTAAPAPSVSVEVSVGSSPPDSLVICLTVSSVSMSDCRSAAAPSGSSAKRYTRVLDGWTASTGLYPYTVEVRSLTGGSSSSQYAYGKLAVVNRAGSPYGAGWWLTGVDQVVGNPASTDTLLWVGADASTRVFTSIGTSGGIKRFVAKSLDRPDTVFYNSSAGDLYRRHVKDRFTTHFSTSTGFYTSTTSAYGTVVDSAVYTGSSGAATSWYMGATYALSYTSSKLDSVVAPSAGSTARRVRLLWTGSKVDSIVDPDNKRTQFVYTGGTNRISARIDRRNTRNTYAYNDTTRRVRYVVEDSGSGKLNLATTLYAAEGRGASRAGAEVDSVYTLVDGPRSGTIDVSKLWINAYGAPTRIRDPLGAETQLTYDATWPMLVKSVRNPMRLLTESFYNSRGLEDSTRTIGLRTGTDTSVTRYTWDSKWRSVTATTAPTGEATSASYDATYGHTDWQQTGSSSSTRVTYAYNLSGLTAGTVKTVSRPPSSAVDSLYYDGNGNLSRTRSAIGFVSLVFRDGAGRDTLGITPVDSATGRDSTNLLSSGSRAYTRYDVMGRVNFSMTKGVGVTDLHSISHPADSLWVTHAFDDIGRVTATKRFYRKTAGGAIDSLTTTYAYDNANRKYSETQPGASARQWAFDEAGNVIQEVTPRGDNIYATYDGANRLTRRIVP